MGEIRQYLISVTAAAILCGIIQSIVGKKGMLAAIVKLLAGLFLSLSVISPFAKLRLADITDYTTFLSDDASEAVQAGKMAAQDALAARIKSETEAYILDKAKAWGIELAVDVIISDSDPPVPCAVTLSGGVSPYAKVRLSQMLEDELGIPKEEQAWIG